MRDVSRFHPTPQGDGVTLDAILETSGVRPDGKLSDPARRPDDFHVSVPLEPLRDQGIVVYRLGARRWGRARRPDPLPDPRPVRLPHRRAGRLRQREVPEPDRADAPARPRHAARRREVARGASRRSRRPAQAEVQHPDNASGLDGVVPVLAGAFWSGRSRGPITCGRRPAHGLFVPRRPSTSGGG